MGTEADAQSLGRLDNHPLPTVILSRQATFSPSHLGTCFLREIRKTRPSRESLLSRRSVIGGGLAAAAWGGLAPATSLPVLAAQSAPTGGPPRLRITDIESFSVELPLRELPRDPFKQYRYSVTRVRTDHDVVGTSFIGISPNVLERWVKPTLIG